MIPTSAQANALHSVSLCPLRVELATDDEDEDAEKKLDSH